MTIQTKITVPEQAEFLSEAPISTPAPSKPNRSRKLLIGASLLMLAGAGWLGWDYWTVGRFEVSTDDAYVQADNTTAAPKVSGYLDAVQVEDNQHVKAGQILAHIDDRDFKAALDQARANVAASQANIDRQKAALETQQSIIDAARAAVAVDLANQTFAHQDDKRYAILAANGYGSEQNSQQASSRVGALTASIARDNASLTTAIKQVDQIKAELAQAEAALARDQANQRQAELNLSYTTVVAAVDGVVGNRTLRVGQYVQAGTQLMTIVPLQAAYLVANFKETQLTHVRAGQEVEIEVDMFPGVKAHGHVDSLAPASGQEFALLPPDNATGNFTKIVQRIPVKIILDPDSPLVGDLRPGMSVDPTIMTKPQPRTVTASVSPAAAS
jgi:membrane fusion protein, multidrug efflux system